MSYANGTTHYNLPQTVGSDKRDWFDTNEAFRQVDEALHTAVTDSGTALDQISQAETDIQTVDGKVDALDGRVTTIEGKQATDEENIAQNSLAISNLANKVDEVDTDLAEMIEVTEEASATASVEHVVGSYFRYNGNLWRTTVLIRVGDEIVPNVNCETTDVMTRVYNLEHSGGGSVSADAVNFDNTGTDLSSTNVEDVVKEINNKLPSGSVIDDTTTSTDSTWSSTKISTPVAGDTRYNTTSNKMEYYNGTQWVEISNGGGDMRCAKFGTFAINGQTAGATISVDISDCNFTSPEDYYVILNGNAYGSNNEGLHLSAKTATSFTVVSDSSNTLPGSERTISYQIITSR